MTAMVGEMLKPGAPYGKDGAAGKSSRKRMLRGGRGRLDFGELAYSKSIAAQIAEARKHSREVAAVLRAGEFSCGVTYLSKAKQLHVRL